MTILKGPEIKISGEFELTVRNAKNNEIKNSIKFKNLILNSGLNRMAKTSVSDYLIGAAYIGTGTNAPTVNDVNLQSQSASTTTIQSNGASSNSSTSPYYTEVYGTFRFNAGQLNGNYTEVGVGGASVGQLFSRALIADGVGSPTSITVLSDEFLDVTYRYRTYVPMSDYSFQIDIPGVGTGINVTARPIGFPGQQLYSNNNYNNANDSFTLVGTNNTNITPYVGWFTARITRLGVSYYEITNMGRIIHQNFIAPSTATALQSITTHPGTQLSAAGSRPSSPASVSVSSPAYVTDSFTQSTTVVFGLNANNTSWQHLVVGFAGCGVWQFLFDTPIPKSADKTFTITFQISWGRYTP